jgi:hypothetical protein
MCKCLEVLSMPWVYLGRVANMLQLVDIRAAARLWLRRPSHQHPFIPPRIVDVTV